MPYTDFTLETIGSALGITVESGDLHANLAPAAVPGWTRELLERGLRQVLLSEKARSEFLVVPLLLACQEMCPSPISIYSGQRLDVDAELGLVGECDFILAGTTPVPALRAPLLTIVEAKKNDIESGVWQCVAQMVGARLFNEWSDLGSITVHGCVTNGEVWQFLRLSGTQATLDRRRYYIDNAGGILAVLNLIAHQARAVQSL